MSHKYDTSKKNNELETANLVITSIGTATPAVCASVAQEIDIPPELFVRAVLQAPTVLFHSISTGAAEKLRDSLNKFGLISEVTQLSSPKSERLYDVAVHLESMLECDAVFNSLADFIGASKNDVVRIVSDAPGVILGDVSEATVDALRDRMSAFDVHIMAACKTESLFDLFLSECDVFTQRYLRDSLGDDLEILNSGGVMCRDLDYDRMEKVWTRMRAVKGLKIINQAFERWDIYLDGGQKNPTSITALSDHCDIPIELCEQLFDHCPIVVAENITTPNLKTSLKALTDAGLTARAELTTFQHAKVTVTDTSQPKQCLALLQSLGLAPPKQTRLTTPLTVPQALPSFDARMLCNKLSNLGCTYEMEILA